MFMCVDEAPRRPLGLVVVAALLLGAASCSQRSDRASECQKKLLVGTPPPQERFADSSPGEEVHGRTVELCDRLMQNHHPDDLVVIDALRRFITSWPDHNDDVLLPYHILAATCASSTSDTFQQAGKWNCVEMCFIDNPDRPIRVALIEYEIFESERPTKRRTGTLYIDLIHNQQPNRGYLFDTMFRQIFVYSNVLPDMKGLDVATPDCVTISIAPGTSFVPKRVGLLTDDGPVWTEVHQRGI